MQSSMAATRFHIPRARKPSAIRMAATAAHKAATRAAGRPLVCEIPGCGCHLVETHHIRRVADGGISCPSNFVNLCPTHHAIADILSRKHRDVELNKTRMIMLIREEEARKSIYHG
jgi:hypothetical protein